MLLNIVPVNCCNQAIRPGTQAALNLGGPMDQAALRSHADRQEDL